ncbi:hypothetical protein DSO57_1004543 [Entomophthora muscae]|uniref:Uncharacterized protein n=1 Tax=Entomophthora muscae TaxID=34485 RepID=A0ACC2SA05_9FUNG|nr:hypothetical protein DSO57_1004543 [Entomophthora muscae]
MIRSASRFGCGVGRLVPAPRFFQGISKSHNRFISSITNTQRYLTATCFPASRLCEPSNLRKMTTISQNTDGCVLGYFDTLELGPGASKLDASLVESLKKHLKATGAKGKQGETRLYASPESSPTRIALISLGVKPQDPLVLAERSRHANGTGAKLLKSVGAVNIATDNSFGTHNAAEGALLGLYNYNLSKKLNAKVLGDKKDYEIKEDEQVKASPLFKEASTAEVAEGFNWDTGAVYAEAQNRARFWMDSPANLMTPTIFASHVQELASSLDNLQVLCS